MRRQCDEALAAIDGREGHPSEGDPNRTAFVHKDYIGPWFRSA
jgi:hypothetical protein